MIATETSTTGPDAQLISAAGPWPPAHETQGGLVVEIDPGRRFQTIDGFGGSFTDSSAFLVDQELTRPERRRAMRLLFDTREGIGLSVIRNPMGASDFAREVYSYDDLEPGEVDPELLRFSIDHDRESIIPLTLWAKRLNPALRVFASPWSPPGWMKTSGSMITGQLLPRWESAYAAYFVRYIEAYRDAGIEIAAVTPQNEPLYVPEHYPGAHMPAAQQRDFVENHLRPALARAGLTPKILGYDHNWDVPEYPLHLFAGAHDAFDGVAWHWYGGSPDAQSLVAREYPDKEIHLTEASGGEWIPEFWPAFTNLLRMGIDILRNGSRSFVLWNLALDLDGGPTVPGFGRSVCRGLLRVDRATGTFEPTVDFTALGHFSRHIRPGAVRVASSEPAPLRSVAAVNADDTLAVVLFNDSEDDVECTVTVEGRSLRAVSLRPGSATTICLSRWRSDLAAHDRSGRHTPERT